MLIKHGSNRIVNLTNVSNIFVEEDKQRVIFNMNYSVKIFGNKVTPDYTYWDYTTEDEKQEIVDLIQSKLRETSWIFPENDTLRYVNLDCVSSIGFDDHKNRIIFNLNYPVTHPKDDRKLTSDYVFWNFHNDTDTYNKVAENFEFLANKI